MGCCNFGYLTHACVSVNNWNNLSCAQALWGLDTSKPGEIEVFKIYLRYYSTFPCIVRGLYFLFVCLRGDAVSHFCITVCLPCPRTFLGSCYRAETRYKEGSTFDREYSDIPLVLRISVKVFRVFEGQKILLSIHLLSLLRCQKIIQKKS